MQSIAEQLENASTLNHVTIPDLWQQQAVSALREGKDVVVHAPTGAGKTLVFELWSNQGKNRGQAIYTVPTRALANDKLAEWRARGWNVGISTGDLSDNLNAPVLVATLETQKNRLIHGDGPSLLVIDEYQMLGDDDRGLNYELAIALAPPQTQLLLLSSSVENPQHVVRWLERLGRKAVLIKYDHRPVPLEEVHANNISVHVPNQIKGYWPRIVAKSLAENLGPILIFAPRRQGTEQLAAELTRQLPTPNPLSLSNEQKLLVGDHLAKMLKSRIAYHHSGLSYAARAGVIEPLAKAGQLRVVVATMGLAAGINFSLRSVALAGESYRKDYKEQPIRPDEILQMFGRAGRRGLDETGFVLITANQIRLIDGRAAFLARSGSVDWGALLSLMTGAAENGRDPFAEAVRVQERLFTTKPVYLGVEECLKNPNTPCGLHTDAERARHVRHRVRQMLNSRGEWETYPQPTEKPLGEVFVQSERVTLLKVLPASSRQGLETAGAGEDQSQSPDKVLPACSRQGLESSDTGENQSQSSPAGVPIDVPELEAAPPSPCRQVGTTDQLHCPAVLQAGSILISALSVPDALEKVGHGLLAVLSEDEKGKTYGRSITVADKLRDERIVLAKWVRRLVNWNNRQTTLEQWETKVVPLLEKKLASQNTPVARFSNHPHKIMALVSLAQMKSRVPVDSHGVALWKPIEREIFPPDCSTCPLVPVCQKLPTSTGVALLWRRLGLVDAAGIPTRRGRIVSFFQQGDGLAVAAALEDETYPIDELIYDLANLDASFRFCGEEHRWAGRLAYTCQKVFAQQTIPGYLEMGAPPGYGSGAEQVVASIHKDPLSKHEWATELLGTGDIDRVIIEWRSLMRQIGHAPDLDWPRWLELKKKAKTILNETESPTLTDLPPLEYHQTKRIDHYLVLRRH